MTAKEIVDECVRYRPYLKNGGITLTGGEPMLQIEFTTEILRLAKEKGIHTCLDTSGILFRDDEAVKKLCEVTDLVLLDIKHMDESEHHKLTGHSNSKVFAFAKYIEKLGIPVWIRHVVVPGITYQEEELTKLGHYIATLSNVKAIDVLPYHDLGKSKYEKLGIPYPLNDVSPLTKEEAIKARNIVLKAYKEQRMSGIDLHK